MNKITFGFALFLALAIAGGGAYALQGNVVSGLTGSLSDEGRLQSPLLRVDGDHEAMKTNGTWSLHCRAHCRADLRLCPVIGPDCYDDAPIRSRLNACYQKRGC